MKFFAIWFDTELGGVWGLLFMSYSEDTAVILSMWSCLQPPPPKIFKVLKQNGKFCWTFEMVTILWICWRQQTVISISRAACRQTVSAGGPFWSFLPGGLLVWCPLAKSKLTLESPHLLAKGSGWQLWQWQETRNPVTLKAAFRAHRVGPWDMLRIFLGCPCPSVAPWSAGLTAISVSSSAFSREEGKRKALFFGPFSGCFGI